MQHDRLGSCIAAALLTGARQGELLGLELDRVTDELDLSWQLKRFSWAHGCCNVSKPWEPVCGAKQGSKWPERRLDAPEDQEFRHLTGGLWLSRPKSAAGWRVAPLVNPLRSIIERRIQVAASEPNPHGLLWTSEPNRRLKDPNGKPTDPRVDNRAWHAALDHAGLPDANLHLARHTAVDLLYSEGVDEVTIAEILGHSTYLMSRRYRTRGNRNSLRDALRRAYRPLTTAPPTSPGEHHDPTLSASGTALVAVLVSLTLASCSGGAETAPGFEEAATVSPTVSATPTPTEHIADGWIFGYQGATGRCEFTGDEADPAVAAVEHGLA